MTLPALPSTKNVPKIAVPRERFELSCGATLLVHRRVNAPVTAVRIHIRGGPGLDPVGKEGLAYMAGAFADQGTETKSDEDIAMLLEPEGGAIQGDAMGLSGAVAGSSWGLLLDVLGEVMASATYPDERVATHLDRLKTRLAVEAEDPRAQGGILFKKLIYGEEHFLGRSAYGTLASASTITPEDMRAHRAAYWCGKRVVIAVVGDVDPSAVRDRAEAAFAALPPGTPHERVEPVFPARGPRRATFERDRNQVHVYLGHLGIKRSHPDYVPLAVLDHVLGTGPGFTNRITQKLRDQMGLAYTVYADIHGSAGLLPGMFRAYIGTSPEHVNTAIEGFLTEMNSIRDELVPAEELGVAQSYLVGSFSMGFERASRRASYLISAELHGFPADHLERLPAEFAAVTPDDVQRVAREHLLPDVCSIALSGPRVELTI